jgi:hypothetical protein
MEKNPFTIVVRSVPTSRTVMVVPCTKGSVEFIAPRTT